MQDCYYDLMPQEKTLFRHCDWRIRQDREERTLWSVFVDRLTVSPRKERSQALLIRRYRFDPPAPQSTAPHANTQTCGITSHPIPGWLHSLTALTACIPSRLMHMATTYMTHSNCLNSLYTLLHSKSRVGSSPSLSIRKRCSPDPPTSE